MHKVIKICGIDLFDGDLKSAVKLISTFLNKSNHEVRQISLTGAHGIVLAQNDIEFRDILNSCYLNLPDGMPGVWLAKIKGASNIERCYGPDLFEEVMVETALTNLKHYFVGGRVRTPENLKKCVEKKYENFNVVGTFSPPFRRMNDEELDKLAERINRVETDIVWIGISTPKQERLAFRLKNVVNAKFVITVGAAFDFHTGNVIQSPKILQKLGLEWFFRLMIEPRRLFPRYIKVIPHFLYLAIKEILSRKI